jgi:tRNA nucleotidyltransferase (CCA-adding enzyme)
MNNIFNEVKKIIPDIYLVGGSVRDMILGIEPIDYDFTTPYLPEEVENRIREVGKKPYCVGKRFGTIGMKVNGLMIEITTFRQEKYEEGNRKPEVRYVSNIEEDLSRRDLTINAIAYDGSNFIDPFGGRKDLEQNLIKCVGKASERFKDDPLRMLRVARFSSKFFGAVIDEETEESAKQLNYKILEVSKERWVAELDKLLTYDYIEIGLNYLMRTNLMNFIIPELSLQKNYNQNSPYHSLNLWEHTLKLTKSLPIDIELRWAGLLHDIAKPFTRTENKKGYSNYLKHDLLGGEIILKLALYLKWSNDRRNNVYNLIVNHLLDNSPLKKYDTEAK